MTALFIFDAAPVGIASAEGLTPSLAGMAGRK